jgi:hypothetical protein
MENKWATFAGSHNNSATTNGYLLPEGESHCFNVSVFSMVRELSQSSASHEKV